MGRKEEIQPEKLSIICGEKLKGKIFVFITTALMTSRTLSKMGCNGDTVN